MGVNKVYSLSDLSAGEKAVILGYQANGDRGYRRKLMAMGLTPHAELEVIRRAPLGDPIQIKVRNTYLSLRKDEAVLLKLQRV